MDLKEIMSVSGQGSLFKFISQGRNGIIVESFVDHKRSFVSASQKVSSLGDIAIFTENDEVPLADVFKNIHQQQPGIPAPEPKSSPEVLREFMKKILPEYDEERVYISDIKKLVNWYNILLDLNLLNFEDEKEDKETIDKTVAEKNSKIKENKSSASIQTDESKTTSSKKTTSAKKTSAKNN